MRLKCSVLIDTWWNVNYFFEINGIGGHAVLIDTWWNVNIVACGGLAWYIKVLIDTWWNVNFNFQTEFFVIF